MLKRFAAALFCTFVAAGSPPVLELDHFFVVVTPGAVKEAEALRAIGIAIDTATARHDGQGTASMAAFFENAYLEVLWVDSSVTTDSLHEGDHADFARAAAWRRSGASPFGLGLHFVSGTRDDLPIPTRVDSAGHLRPGAYYILLRQPAESLAPDMFIMPEFAAATSWIERYRTRNPDRFAHPSQLHRITSVTVYGPPRQRPRAADLAIRMVRFETAATPYAVLEFDGGQGGREWDLRPTLPIVLRN